MIREHRRYGEDGSDLSAYSIVVGDYPHSKPIKSGERPVEACDLEFLEFDPIHSAFAPMVRELRFDICELAVATYLQAREVGKAISLLPVVLRGDFHHRSLKRWSGAPAISPAELHGKRVGVRAYSQTTGLWVRGALEEDYGITSDEVTWVTTEGPHVVEYEEPENVERTSGNLIELLRSGDIAAAIPGPTVVDVDGDGDALVAVIDDWQAAEAAWFDRHKAVPINHMLTVQTKLLESDPAAVKGVYDAFAASIEATRPSGDSTSAQRVVTYGRSEALEASLEAAIGYALSQRLIATPVTVPELFADFERHVGF